MEMQEVRVEIRHSIQPPLAVAVPVVQELVLLAVLVVQRETGQQSTAVRVERVGFQVQQTVCRAAAPQVSMLVLVGVAVAAKMVAQ
jgi:hypothetical protein